MKKEVKYKQEEDKKSVPKIEKDEKITPEKEK